MVFCRSFPRTVEGKNYPEWVDIYLNKDEEAAEVERARLDNMEMLERCINDAKNVFRAQKLKDFQTDIICVAIAMFEKLGSHSVYFKEEKAKRKFDMIFKSQIKKKK